MGLTVAEDNFEIVSSSLCLVGAGIKDMCPSATILMQCWAWDPGLMHGRQALTDL